MAVHDRSNRLGPLSRPAVKISPETLVRTYPLDAERGFPWVVEPATEGCDLRAYAAGHREMLETELAARGAILFRGFRLSGMEEFQALVGALSAGALEYRERSSPRLQVSGNIYTSTEHPQDQRIFLHNEQSYNLEFPRKILFFCAQAAVEGGATPIADCRQVLKDVPAAVRERFSRLGYLYVRNFGGGFGLSWQEAFQTADRGEVEAYCNAHRIELEWRDGGKLRTRQRRQVIARHPRTGTESWCNHLTFFHVSTLEPAVRDLLLSELREEELPNNTYYGDGSPIEDEVLEALRASYRRSTLTFPWRQGDVLLLDNLLTAHGREPYSGPRRVVVGMADPVAWDEVGGERPETGSER
jgi:alpha-ketoglutarate-dependent taurine dioxygenase